MIEESWLMICMSSRSYNIKNYRYSLICPKSEKLSSSLNVRIIKNTSRKIIKFTLINNGRGGRPFFINQITVDIIKCACLPFSVVLLVASRVSSLSGTIKYFI